MTDHTSNTIASGTFFSAVVQGRNITVQLPRRVTPALSGLPRRSRAFIGRDAKLREVLDILAPPESPGAGARRTRLLTVTGMPGVGKTELAVQAADAAQAEGWFPGGALFVNLLGYSPVPSRQPGQTLDGLLRALGIPGEDIPPGEQDRAGLYRSVLSAYADQGRPILVLIDNAAGSSDAELLLPADDVTGAIVTSRESLALLGIRRVDLDVLDPADATELLRRELAAADPADTRVTDHPGEATQIACYCGNLPLALHITAALLAEDSRRQLDSMAADLSDPHSRLQVISVEDIAVAAAFSLSYQRLLDRHPEHAALLRLLSVCPGPDFSTRGAAVVACLAKVDAQQGLQALARAHLIERGASSDRWRMHDLLRLYAQELAAAADTDGAEAARGRLLHYYQDMAAKAGTHLEDRPDRTASAHFGTREAALAWLDRERLNLVAAVTMAAATGHDDIAIGLPLALGQYFYGQRRFGEWLGGLLTGLDAARRVSERTGDRSTEGAVLNDQGWALKEAGRFDDAIADCREAWAIFEDNGDLHSKGGALTNLGLALHQVRQFAEAATALQDAAAIFSATRDWHGQSIALTNSGLALAAMQRPDEAIRAHQDAVAISRAHGDRREEAGALTNLGDAQQKMGRLDEAVSAEEQAASIYHEFHIRHSEGIALGRLGISLRRMGRLDEAIAKFTANLSICRDTGDRAGEAMVQQYLGETLQDARQFAEAATSHQAAAAIFGEIGDSAREAQARAEAARACAQDAARS